MGSVGRRAGATALLVLGAFGGGTPGDADGPALERAKPPLYIVSMMHAEEKLYFKEDEQRFCIHADNLRRLVKQFDRHGAKLAFQPDWTFVEGARQWDPDLFADLLSAGMGVDAHAHGTKVSLEEVGERLKGCGVPEVRVGNGDWSKVPAVRPPPNANLFWPFGLPWEGTGKPYFEALCAYKNPATGVSDRAMVVWRPARRGDWHVHDRETPFVYIGGGPAGDVHNLWTIPQAVNQCLKQVRVGYVNVAYWHDSLHNYGHPHAAEMRMAEWEHVLTEALDPLAEAGEVKWATFTEMLDAHLALEQAGKSHLQAGQVVPQMPLLPKGMQPAGLPGARRPGVQ